MITLSWLRARASGGWKSANGSTFDAVGGSGGQIDRKENRHKRDQVSPRHAFYRYFDQVSGLVLRGARIRTRQTTVRVVIVHVDVLITGVCRLAVSNLFTLPYQSETLSVVSNAVIRVYDDAGKVIETHEHKGDFKEP